MTEPFVQILRSEELSEGQLKKIVIPGRDELVALRWQGAVFVLDDRCTHGMASLSEGYVEDDILICPFHGGGFDVKTGKAAEAPCKIAIKAYEVQEADGIIKIR